MSDTPDTNLPPRRSVPDRVRQAFLSVDKEVREALAAAMGDPEVGRRALWIGWHYRPGSPPPLESVPPMPAEDALPEAFKQWRAEGERLLNLP